MQISFVKKFEHPPVVGHGYVTIEFRRSEKSCGCEMRAHFATRVKIGIITIIYSGLSEWSNCEEGIKSVVVFSKMNGIKSLRVYDPVGLANRELLVRWVRDSDLPS